MILLSTNSDRREGRRSQPRDAQSYSVEPIQIILSYNVFFKTSQTDKTPCTGATGLLCAHNFQEDSHPTRPAAAPLAKDVHGYCHNTNEYMNATNDGKYLPGTL